MKLKLRIINLDGVYFDGEVDLVNLSTSAGQLTILANHLPLITNINISMMYTKNDGVETKYAISGGTLFVTETECKIITSAIENEKDIDYSRAEAAKERAEKRLSSATPDIDMMRAEVSLKRAINRLNLRG